LYSLSSSFSSSSFSSSSFSLTPPAESKWCAPLQALNLQQAVHGSLAWRTNLTLLHAGSSESEQEPEAAQAESAQGFESAQEDFVAPQPPTTAASTKGRGSGGGEVEAGAGVALQPARRLLLQMRHKVYSISAASSQSKA